MSSYVKTWPDLSIVLSAILTVYDRAAAQTPPVDAASIAVLRLLAPRAVPTCPRGSTAALGLRHSRAKGKAHFVNHAGGAHKIRDGARPPGSLLMLASAHPRLADLKLPRSALRTIAVEF